MKINIERKTIQFGKGEAFWDMIVAFFQQGQNGPDLGWGKKLTLFVKSMKTCPYP